MDPHHRSIYASDIDTNWLHHLEQNPLDINLDLDHQFNYSNQDLTHLINMDKVLPQDHVSSCDLSFPYFDPIDEYLNLWDFCDDGDQFPLLTYNDYHRITESHGYTSGGESKSVATSGGRRGLRRSRPLELEEIEKHYEMPIAKAAEKMEVGLTLLKKRCRQLNIKRWPHRKLKSIKSLMQNVKEMGLKEEMEMLEEQSRIIKKVPEMQITQRTKKLRQACFKANYKKRRLAC